MKKMTKWLAVCAVCVMGSVPAMAAEVPDVTVTPVSYTHLGKEIRFLCRGKGHGLGFSQYGGNEMAKESANAKEILQYYFPEMDVLNIKSVNC